MVSSLTKHATGNISFSDCKDLLPESFKKKRENMNALKKGMRWLYKVNVLQDTILYYVMSMLYKNILTFLGNCLFYIILIRYLCLLGEACWWTIHPASKQRSEGEKVRIGDDLILVSVSSERYLVGLFI